MLKFQGIPSFDAPDGIVRAWYFEPFVAVASFFFWIHVYWWAERQRGLSRINNMFDAARQPIGYSVNSVIAYSVGICLWKMFVPPAAATIPDGTPTSISELCYLVLELASGIVLYDFIFFFIHWGMHEIPVLRKFHHHHHAMTPGTLEARDVVHHSLADGTLQVLVNIFVQRFTPWGAAKSRLARLLHNILVTWMLTESHSASPDFQFWRPWLVGVREHRLHHLHDNSSRSRWVSTSWEPTSSAKFDRHQQFFGYLDDARFLYREWKVRTKLVPPKKLG